MRNLAREFLVAGCLQDLISGRLVWRVSQHSRLLENAVCLKLRFPFFRRALGGFDYFRRGFFMVKNLFKPIAFFLCDNSIGNANGSAFDNVAGRCRRRRVIKQPLAGPFFRFRLQAIDRREFVFPAG